MAGPHIMVVEARFYPKISDALFEGAAAALEAGGATHERFAVPGALEIPSAIRIAVRAMDFPVSRSRFDGYVALGCVVRGQTSHYDIVAMQSAQALQELALRFTLAIGNGILTVENEDQAWVRANKDGRNKGGWAANACLAMIGLKSQFELYPR